MLAPSNRSPLLVATEASMQQMYTCRLAHRMHGTDTTGIAANSPHSLSPLSENGAPPTAPTLVQPAPTRPCTSGCSEQRPQTLHGHGPAASCTACRRVLFLTCTRTARAQHGTAVRNPAPSSRSARHRASAFIRPHNWAEPHRPRACICEIHRRMTGAQWLPALD